MRKFKKFSPKQLQVLNWWCLNSPYFDKSAIICDGAIRSGKSVCMSLSFIMWAFFQFDGQSFALCGKTIRSLKRNLIHPLTSQLKDMGAIITEKYSENYLDISFSGKTNRFYLFGGKDESSASLVQGITLAGVLLDEVALMPRSFVEQAIARCSVENSRFWFNCNPEHPYHWFYKEWIVKSDEKNALYIHFEMTDNPSLSNKIIERYKNLYSGMFYQRYVLGEWVAAEGRVYTMFDENVHVVKSLPDKFSRFIVSCDYGTVNPCSFGLWGFCKNKWYRIQEYYFDSKLEGFQKTDGEHFQSLLDLVANRKIEKIIVDPSAASFIQVIRKSRKFVVEKADNNVLDGIRKVSDILRQGKIALFNECKDSIREFSLYRWKNNCETETPIKQNDHAMDDIRYFVMNVFTLEENGFFAASVKRN